VNNNILFSNVIRLSGKEGTDMKIKEQFFRSLKIFVLFAFVFSFLTLFSTGAVLAQDIQITDFEYEIERVQSGGYRIYDITVWIYNNRNVSHDIEYIELSCSSGSGDLQQFSDLSRTTLEPKSTLDFSINGEWLISGACTEVTIDIEYGANSVKSQTFMIDAAEYYTLSHEADLNFGSFSADAVGTSVTVYSDGGINYDSPVHLENYQPAEFKVEGPAGSSFSVELPANGEIFVYNGSTAMSVVDFESDSTGIIGNDYTDYFNVGATLEVDPLQTPGTYTGVFSVIITLQ
jgi:hypothetical protein